MHSIWLYSNVFIVDVRLLQKYLTGTFIPWLLKHFSLLYTSASKPQVKITLHYCISILMHWLWVYSLWMLLLLGQSRNFWQEHLTIGWLGGLEQRFKESVTSNLALQLNHSMFRLVNPIYCTGHWHFSRQKLQVWSLETLFMDSSGHLPAKPKG